MAKNKDYTIANVQVAMPTVLFEDASLVIRKGLILQHRPMSRLRKSNKRVLASQIEIDFENDIIIPGLIDLHVHGAGGADMMDASPEAIGKMSCALLREGTTAFLGTTMSAPFDKVADVANVARAFTKLESGAELLGMHMEGPFLNPDFKGAQPDSGLVKADCPPKKLQQWLALLERYSEVFRILTLAPEHPAAPELIQCAIRNKIIVSAGHSGATYEQMRDAVSAGVRLMTHTFNGMAGIHHRQPGLVTAALLDSRVALELIADGVHVHPAILELVLRLKSLENLFLVSDGTRAVGMPDGNYKLGGQPIRVKDKQARLSDGTLAGSAASLLDGVRTMVKIGFRLVQVVRMASYNQACLLGVENRIGSLERGCDATFLRLSPDLNLKEVWVRGARIH